MILILLPLPSLNNLSVANYIHILEPQWNPSVESQAIGRVVRLGQTKPVTVFRYLVKDTVEKVSWGLSPFPFPLSIKPARLL